MKTRAFKKAISVVCVLSMLLSLCVVSFVGTASAAGTDYTLNNNGVVYTLNLAKGAAIPAPTVPTEGVTFLGWYDDINFTNKVTVAGNDTTLFAKYDGIVATFDYTDANTNGIYDPNGKFGNNQFGAFQIVADPHDANNKVLLGDQLAGGKNTINTAIEAYPGSGKGVTCAADTQYIVSFRYMATKGTQPYEQGVKISAYVTKQEGIGNSDSKQSIATAYFDYTDDWAVGNLSFTLSAANVTSYPYLLFTVGDGNYDRGKVYIDDIVIKPYVPQVVVEDYVMDFEDVDNNGFEWSVDANDYTYNTGNGYVTRGEILANEDNTNKFFKLTHSKSKNGHHYFTVNNGADQLAMVNGGIYTVEFDYFVEHSETPTKLNLYYVNTDGKGAVKTITVIDEFDYRDDDAAQGWAHAKYTFIATSDAETYSSIGIGMSNSTNCPEEFATAVLFDNVRVQTHSTTGEDAIIVFESNGGDECESIAVEVGRKPADLPAPTKYGYDFVGWKYDVTTGEGEEAVTTTYDLTTSTIMPAGIMNAYAAWNLKAGVVELSFRTNVEEYDANVGKIVAFPGQPIIGMPENPEYDNQTFVGWYLDRNFNKALDVNSAPSTSLTLFAKWETDGVVIDYEDYTITDIDRKSDRYKIITEANGNKVLSHSLEYGTNKSATQIARAMFQDAGKVIRAYEGARYVVKFKYKVEDFKTQGRFYIFLSNKGGTWVAYKQQTGSVAYSDNTNGWAEGVIEFDATLATGATANDNYMAIGCSGDATLYIDDVVISCPENDMNIYGSAIRFNVNGGKAVNAISGDEGDTIVLPTPKKNGYKFIGWYTDNTFATKFTDTKFGADPIVLHAKWQLGKIEENFENYPASVVQLGIAAGYTLYTNTAVGFDSSNIRHGSFSVFRNGATAGVKTFTLMRSDDYALDVGETYTLKFWVKPTAISVDTGVISLMSMTSFTGISAAQNMGTVIKYSDLKEGEWQQVSYTFVATTPFVGIGTTVGCDMYFDDASITLKGYTGSASTDSAPTGDSSVSPIIILAVIILSAGALLITGKKVFAK